jgi:hypothetical protein
MKIGLNAKVTREQALNIASITRRLQAEKGRYYRDGVEEATAKAVVGMPDCKKYLLDEIEKVFVRFRIGMQ